MGNKNDIKATVSELICSALNLDPAELARAQTLREIRSVDSINMVRAIARIEDHFDIELDDDLVFEIRTLDDLVAEVERQCE